MAFNLARYNLASYNTDAENVRYISGAVGYESVSVSIGSALDIYVNGIGNERVNTQLEGSPTKYYQNAIGSETVSELVADGQMSIILTTIFNEAVTKVITESANIHAFAEGTETVTGSDVASADLSLSSSGSENVISGTVLDAIISASAEGFELVSESASLEIIDLKTCVLTLTLKPGERLIVDAGSYNVLLNGQNAIDTHSGDWIDELDRETTDITISAASGVSALSASIVYTERYL